MVILTTSPMGFQLLPPLCRPPCSYAILAAAMVVKAVLWWWCYSLRNESAAVLALAEDNANDAVANAGR